MVWPSRCSSPRSSHSASRLCGSSPAVGSSRNSTDGRWKMALATISRCAIPPDRAYTDAFAHLDSWNCTSSSSAIRRDSFAPMPNSRPWKYRFSHTVSWRSRVFCCETIPLSCLASAGCAATSMPDRNAAPRCRHHPGGQDARRRRLARAVGAEQAEDLAGLDVEAEPVDRGEVRPRVHLGQVLGVDDRGRLAIGGRRPPSSASRKCSLPAHRNAGGPCRRCPEMLRQAPAFAVMAPGRSYPPPASPPRRRCRDGW